MMPRFINYVLTFICDIMVAKLENLPIGKVDFDFENPRIAMALEMYRRGKVTDEQVTMALNDSTDKSEAGTTIQVLRDSIRSTGCITQPIIVNHAEGRYIVIEGNTRLMIYKEFAEKGVKGDWGCIPAYVYEDMSEEQKHSVRLQSHIVGPRAWNPYSKAKYLKKLRDEDLLSTERIIDICGGKKQEIIEMISAYDDMERYYRPKAGDSFDPRQFSAFRELNATKKRIFALESRGHTKDDFAKWVLDGKIGEATNVRKIAEVFNDDTLYRKFKEKDLKTAIADIHPPADVSNIDIKALADALVTKVGNISWQDTRAMSSGENTELVDSLSYLHCLLSGFIKEITGNVDG